MKTGGKLLPLRNIMGQVYSWSDGLLSSLHHRMESFQSTSYLDRSHYLERVSALDLKDAAAPCSSGHGDVVHCLF